MAQTLVNLPLESSRLHHYPACTPDQLTLGGIKLRQCFKIDAPLGRVCDTRLRQIGRSGKFAVLIRSGFAYRSFSRPNGSRAILDILVPGDFAGLNNLAAARPSEEIHALGDVIFHALPIEKLPELIGRDDDLAFGVIAAITRMQSRSDRLAAAMGQLEASDRICVFLLDLHDRLHGRGLIREPEYPLPVTQEQIGDHLGLTLVHVNRCLRKLREQEIAIVNRRAVSILDIDRMRKIAEGLPELCVA